MLTILIILLNHIGLRLGKADKARSEMSVIWFVLQKKVLNKFLDNHKTKKNIYLLLFLLLLIIIVEYILSSALNRDDQLDDKIANHYLTDFTMTETNKKGEISWILDGKRLEKFQFLPHQVARTDVTTFSWLDLHTVPKWHLLQSHYWILNM